MSDAAGDAGGRTGTYTDALLRDMLNAAGECASLPPHLRRALELAALGMTAEGAAREQGIKHHTATNYRRRAMRRLNARSIAHAVAIALLLGLLFTDYQTSTTRRAIGD